MELRRGGAGRPFSSIAPSARLVVVLTLSTSAFALSPPLLPMLFLALLLLLALEGLGPLAFARESLPLLWLSAFVLLVETLRYEGGFRLDPAGFGRTGIASLRLFAAFAVGRLFYQTTRGLELREAALALRRVLPRGAAEDAALMLSLVLTFMPMILADWKLSLEAGRARGFGGPLRLGMRLAVIEAFIRRLALDARDLPEILYARGWTEAGSLGRSSWGWGSYAAVAVTAAVAVVSLIF